MISWVSTGSSSSRWVRGTPLAAVTSLSIAGRACGRRKEVEKEAAAQALKFRKGPHDQPADPPLVFLPVKWSPICLPPLCSRLFLPSHCPSANHLRPRRLLISTRQSPVRHTISLPPNHRNNQEPFASSGLTVRIHRLHVVSSLSSTSPVLVGCLLTTTTTQICPHCFALSVLHESLSLLVITYLSQFHAAGTFLLFALLVAVARHKHVVSFRDCAHSYSTVKKLPVISLHRAARFAATTCQLKRLPFTAPDIPALA